MRVPERLMSMAGKDPSVGKLAVQVQFHITGSLEFFKNNFVHSAAGIDQRGGDNGEAAAVLDVAGGAEKSLRACSALESTPPERTLPLGGTTVL